MSGSATADLKTDTCSARPPSLFLSLVAAYERQPFPSGSLLFCKPCVSKSHHFGAFLYLPCWEIILSGSLTFLHALQAEVSLSLLQIIFLEIFVQ